jgi:antitoxin component HigA of HigAB toxin-antitoxin module
MSLLTAPVKDVAHLMDRHGHNQSDMTDIAARPTINAIINGKRKLTREMIERLIRKYRVTGDFFYA